MKKMILFLNLFFVLSCSKNFHKTKSVVWNGEGSAPNLKISNLQSQLNLTSLNEEVVVQKQFIAGVPVEGTYIKNIYQKDQRKLKYINAQFLEDIDKNIILQVQELKQLSNADLWKKLFIEHAVLKDRKRIEEPLVAVVLHEGLFKPVVKFTFFRKDFESLETWVFDRTFRYLYTEESSSHFGNFKALAYPESPKTTQITTVMLNSLKSEMNLLSDQIQVNTESPNKVLVTELLQEANQDEKFDQVQSFYYIQKAITWFEKQMIIGAGQLKVQAQLHIGYPEKTNAAFYHAGVIRLGSGDDIVFSRIPLDPSIVMHEAGHALIDMVASLPFQEEGGSLNEGFADFFTCVQLDNPKLGEVAYKKAPFKRQIEKLVKLSEKNGGLYHDSAIASSLMWSIKQKVGSEKAVAIAIETLKRMTPNSKFEDFRVEIIKQIGENLKDDDLKDVLLLVKDWES